MNKEFIVIRETIENYTNSTFQSGLSEKIDEQIDFIIRIRDLFKTHILDLNDLTENEFKFYKKIENYNRELLSLLQENFVDRNVTGFQEEFSGFIQKYSNYVEELDYKRLEEQDDDRFRLLPGDSFTVRTVKIIKRPAYFITTLPQRSLNFFRKTFKRTPKVLGKWNRSVYLRKLLQMQVRDNLLLKFIEVMSEFNRNLASSYQKIWLGEEGINKHFTEDIKSLELKKCIPDDEEIRQYETEIDSVIQLLRGIKDEIKRTTGKTLDEIFIEFEIYYRKAGTFEYPTRIYSDNKLGKSEKYIKEKHHKLSRGWENTLFALFEDWRLNKDIYINEILGVQELYSLRKEIEQKITERIIPGLDEIRRELLSAKSRIEEQGRTSGLRDMLLKEKSVLSEKLDGRLIIDTAELLVVEGIPESIDEKEANLRRNIDTTLVKRAIVKAQNYDREIRDSEIEYIEPGDIIRFEILPEFLEETQKLKAGVTRQIDDVQKELLNVGQIADFNLESAIASTQFSDEKITPETDPSSIAAEGLKRAVSKTEELKSGLFDIQEKILDSSSDYISSFNKKLLSLRRTDNILEIRLRIAKAKAIEKSVEYRKKTIQSIKHLLPGLIQSFRQIFVNTGDLYQKFRLRLGLEKKESKISAEISDFLTESENAINKLPYVYQRLFRIEPLDDEKFYEPRTKEIDIVQNAFNNWKLERYAPVVLVGEKGSGITTTVNFLINKIKSGEDLIRTDARNTIEYENDFLKLFSGMLNSDFSDYSEIIKSLNSYADKRIIILENIHHLFIRRIGGFKSLQSLFEMISATNSNVFWVLTSNLYAWNYLERVLNISDYFSYIIKLSPFTDEQIVDIIQKRHRVSGFNIRYEPSSYDLQDKNFQKKDEADKQAYLKEKYFSKLNRFARSNLSISLFFWMRSTREVKNNIITIGSLEGLDFSFLQDLSDEKVFTLFALLIHDGLTVKQHSEVFNQSEEKSRLNLLLLSDDGILTQKKNGYIINPLLYRQTVSLLQSRNILH